MEKEELYEVLQDTNKTIIVNIQNLLLDNEGKILKERLDSTFDSFDIHIRDMEDFTEITLNSPDLTSLKLFSNVIDEWDELEQAAQEGLNYFNILMLSSFSDRFNAELQCIDPLLWAFSQDLNNGIVSLKLIYRNDSISISESEPLSDEEFDYYISQGEPEESERDKEIKELKAHYGERHKNIEKKEE